MSSGKMNTITDPLASQKTAAANIGLGNYTNASNSYNSALPALNSYYGSNFGQTQAQTLANQNPMFQSIYGQLQQDTSGQGGPFSALTKNLLGSFDTQQNNTQQQLQQQLQAQGLGGSGAGMAVLGNQGVQAAQARAGLVDQNQVNELNMANQLSQELMNQNQLQGFSNPMQAYAATQMTPSAPSFSNVDNSYYTPAPTDSGFQQGFGDVMSAANAAASIMGGMPPMGGGTPAPSGGNGAPNLSSLYQGSNLPVTGPFNSSLLPPGMMGGG